MSKFIVGDRVKVVEHHPIADISGEYGVVRGVVSRGRYNVELDMDGFNAGLRFMSESLVLVEPDIKVGDTVWVESSRYSVPAQNGTVVGTNYANGVLVRVAYPIGIELNLLFLSHEVSPAREEAETYTQADIDTAYQRGLKDERTVWVIRVEELLND